MIVRILLNQLLKTNLLKHDQVLLAVNSINWTRIIGQICYYFYLCMKINNFLNNFVSQFLQAILERFCMLLSNEIRLPVKKIAVAVNENDILHRFFQKIFIKKN